MDWLNYELFHYSINSGAYPGFSKGGGKEPVRSAGFEPNAVIGEQQAKRAAGGGRGRSPRKIVC